MFLPKLKLASFALLSAGLIRWWRLNGSRSGKWQPAEPSLPGHLRGEGRYSRPHRGHGPVKTYGTFPARGPDFAFEFNKPELVRWVLRSEFG